MSGYGLNLNSSDVKKGAKNVAKVAQRLLLGILITLGFACGEPKLGTDSLGTVTESPNAKVSTIAAPSQAPTPISAPTQAPTPQLISSSDETSPEPAFTGEFALDAVLYLDDLPPNFKELPAAEVGFEVGTMHAGGVFIKSAFLYANADESFTILGFTFPVGSLDERISFDREFNQPDVLVSEAIKGFKLTAPAGTDVRKSGGPDAVSIGDKAIYYQLLVSFEGEDFLSDTIMFRQAGVAGNISTFYEMGAEPPITIGELASKFDERIAAVNREERRNKTGLVPIFKTEVRDLDKRVLRNYSDVPSFWRERVMDQINQVMESGQQVIICQYGPADPVKQTGFTTYEFWYESAPADIAKMLKSSPRDTHPMRSLGRNSVNECPESGDHAYEVLRVG